MLAREESAFMCRHASQMSQVLAHAASESHAQGVIRMLPRACIVYMPLQDGTWAGHIELQAASLLYGVNISVHQSGQPVWTIQNFEVLDAEHTHPALLPRGLQQIAVLVERHRQENPAVHLVLEHA